MKNKFILLTALVLILLLGSALCFFYSAHKETMQLLDRAEAVIREHPDSAYRLLCGIDSTKHLRGENQARYALLMTQAQYKNGIPVPNDSLISIAYDYYCASSDSLHKAWACFYMGQAARDGGNQRDALRYFQQAASAGESTNNYNLLNLIYEHWGNLLQPITPYIEGKNKLLKAQKYAILNKDTAAFIYSSIALSHSHLFLREYQESYKHLTKARQLAKQIIDTNLLFKSYAESALAYNLGKMHKEARSMLDTAMRYAHTIEDSDLINLYHVYLFNNIHQYDSAFYYMKQVRDSSTLIAKADNHFQFYKIEKGRKNFHSAFYHLEKYALLYDSVSSEENKNNLTFLQRHYDYSHYKMQNLRLQTQRRMLWVTIFCLTTFIISISFLIYIRHNRHKRYIDALIHSKDTLIQDSTLKLSQKNSELQQQNQELQNTRNMLEQQEQQLEKLIRQQNEIHSREAEAAHQHKEILRRNQDEKEALYKALLQLQHQLSDNQHKQEELKHRVFHINESVQKILGMNRRIHEKNRTKLSDLKLNDNERQNLFSVFDLCYNDMVTRLRSENPLLTPNDLLYCCLLKMSTSQELICALLSTSPMALKKRKYRIKNEKIEQAGSYDSLESFLQQF